MRIDVDERFSCDGRGHAVAAARRPVGQGALDADARELAAYRLTIETLKKKQVATRAILEEMKKDPKVARMKLEAEIDAL